MIILIMNKSLCNSLMKIYNKKHKLNYQEIDLNRIIINQKQYKETCFLTLTQINKIITNIQMKLP